MAATFNPFGHQLQTELCSKIIALPGVCPGYLSIYLPSLQTGEWKTPFLQTLLLLGAYVSFGGWYLCTSSEKKDKTLFGEAQPQCHHQHLVILKAPKNINHLHIAVTKMPNGRHYQYCKIR
jgi:hypothetical protein